MSKTPDYYQLLEIGLSADMDQIKASYRRLARKYHPDINPGNPDMEMRFKRIVEAYATLSDPQKRASYDRSLRPRQGQQPETPMPKTPKTAHKKPESTASASSPGKSSTSAGSPKNTTPSPDSSSFVDLQGTRFKEMFDNLFKTEEKKAPSPEENGAKSKPGSHEQNAVRGQDITVETVITTPEAEQGVVKTVNIQLTEACRRCAGLGKVNGLVCTLCHGEKQVIILKKLDVRIPAGIKSGSKIRLAREGAKGQGAGEPGDLFLAIQVAGEQRFKIEGLTVSCDIPVSIPEAVLGAEIEVPTLQGTVKMTIPPQTHSGTVFRLKGQGVALNGASGDQYVTIQIVSPKSLSPREKSLYEELARLQKDPPWKSL